MTPELFWWALAIVSLAVSALVSGSEIGSYTLNRVRLAIRANRTPPDRAALLLREEIEHPDRLLATLLITNNIVNYTAAVAITQILECRGLTGPTAALINMLVLAPALFIFSEALPKEIFRVEADRLTYIVARPLRGLRLLMTWVGVLPLVQAIRRAIERWTGLDGGGEHFADARQRMAAMLKEGASSGVLSESQTTLLDRALALRETTVAGEMVPWDEVITIHEDWPMDRVLQAIEGNAHSRMPVVDHHGRVIGVLRQIDLYTRPDAPLAALVAEPARLSPTLSLRDGLLELKRAETRIGIVEKDGRPMGIVTPRDLLEPLVGKLPDW